MKVFFQIVVFISVTLPVLAQTGGSTSYSFLDLDYNARNTALGGSHITAFDNDLNMGIINPAALNKTMHQKFAFNHGFLPSGINQGSFSYGQHIDEIGTLSGYIKYVGYGRFTRTDETGQELGNFTAGDFVIGSGLGRKLNERISIGVNLNLIMSFFEQYSSLGASIDVAGTYHNEEKRLTVTAMVRNAGVQFKSYVKQNRETLPINAMLGISHRLEHAPFRFSLITTNWQQWDLTYEEPGMYEPFRDINGDTIVPKRPGFAEKLFRHAIMNVEIIVTDNFHLRAGFNYLRRQELKIIERPGLSGLSAGFGFQVKHIRIDYGAAFYSAVGMQHQMSFSTSFKDWKKESKTPDNPDIFREK